MATERVIDPRTGMIVAPNLYGLSGAGIVGNRIDGRNVLQTYSPVNAGTAARTEGIGEGAQDYAAQGPSFNGAVEGVFDQAFADRQGFGDLWRSGYVPGGGSGEDRTDATYSPELLDRLSQYQVARLGFGDDMRQFAVIDPRTGQVVHSTQPRAYNNAFQESLAAMAALAGGAALGSWMSGGTAAAGGGAGALNPALIESAVGTAGYGASSAGLGGVTAGGAAAGGALGAGAGSPVAAMNAANLTGTAGLGETVGAAVANGVPAATGAINPALIESAVGTAGYGASSAGAGNALSLAQGGLGVTSAHRSIYDAVVSATGSPQLANLAAQGGSGLQQAWSSMSPLQRMQLGNSLGGLLASSASGSGASTSTAGQRGAGDLQMDIARQLQGLGAAELGTARTRQATFDPQFQQIIERALASQSTNDARSQQAWDEYTNYYMPAGRRMAQTAANFDSPQRRALEAEGAVAGVNQQFDAQRQAQQRALGRTGSSMTANRALTLDAASRFANAKAAATADRAARRDVENTGIALTRDVANFGNQTAGLGLNAANVGLRAGNTAAGTAATRQNTYNASLSPTFNALQGAYGAAGGAGNTYNGVANVNLQRNAQDNAGLAGLGSLIGGLGAAFLAPSDPKIKTVHGKVDGKKALATLSDSKVYDWTYKPGKGDGGRHVGRMAGKGDRDTPQGKAIDVVSELGMHHAAITQLAKEVRRLGLADASEAKITKRRQA